MPKLEHERGPTRGSVFLLRIVGFRLHFVCPHVPVSLYNEKKERKTAASSRRAPEGGWIALGAERGIVCTS